MDSIIRADGWLGVELRHFAALEAVAREGSFGRAADALGYTQSAVSQQIAALERTVGERLVERPGGPRPVSLTEAGRLLLAHAEAIVARLKAAQADMAALHDGAAGTLRVGTFQSVGARILPAVMARFREEWPTIEIQLRESGMDDELATWVERGEIDLAFVMLPIDLEPLETVQLLRDPYVLVVAAGSQLGLDHTPKLREIAAQPLIGYRSCRSMVALEAQLRASGREPNFVFRSEDNGTVQGMAAAGVGVALIPTIALVSSRSDVVVLPLRGHAPVRRIVVAVREGEENLLVEHMIDSLRDAAHALAGRPALHAVA
jgi:DNA-binding transcriptional LysR family regulator